MSRKYKSMSIVKINTLTKERITLYEFISDMEEAFLLSELAMAQKKDYEVVCIFPGWNCSIHKDRNRIDEYEYALELAEKYKTEN